MKLLALLLVAAVATLVVTSESLPFSTFGEIVKEDGARYPPLLDKDGGAENDLGRTKHEMKTEQMPQSEPDWSEPEEVIGEPEEPSMVPEGENLQPEDDYDQSAGKDNLWGSESNAKENSWQSGENEPEPGENGTEPGENGAEPGENEPDPGENGPEPEEDAPEPRENEPEPRENEPEPRENEPEHGENELQWAPEEGISYFPVPVMNGQLHAAVINIIKGSSDCDQQEQEAPGPSQHQHGPDHPQDDLIIGTQLEHEMTDGEDAATNMKIGSESGYLEEADMLPPAGLSFPFQMLIPGPQDLVLDPLADLNDFEPVGANPFSSHGDGRDLSSDHLGALPFLSNGGRHGLRADAFSSHEGGGGYGGQDHMGRSSSVSQWEGQDHGLRPLNSQPLWSHGEGHGPWFRPHDRSQWMSSSVGEFALPEWLSAHDYGSAYGGIAGDGGDSEERVSSVRERILPQGSWEGGRGGEGVEWRLMEEAELPSPGHRSRVSPLGVPQGGAPVFSLSPQAGSLRGFPVPGTHHEPSSPELGYQGFLEDVPIDDHAKHSQPVASWPEHAPQSPSPIGERQSHNDGLVDHHRGRQHLPKMISVQNPNHHVGHGNVQRESQEISAPIPAIDPALNRAGAESTNAHERQNLFTLTPAIIPSQRGGHVGHGARPVTGAKTESHTTRHGNRHHERQNNAQNNADDNGGDQSEVDDGVDNGHGRHRLSERSVESPEEVKAKLRELASQAKKFLFASSVEAMTDTDPKQDLQGLLQG